VYGFVGRITTCIYESKGRTIPQGERRRGTEKPRAGVSFDPARHVVRIVQSDGKIAEFDDRHIRFLVLDRDPITRALKPVIVPGEPTNYYLGSTEDGKPINHGNHRNSRKGTSKGVCQPVKFTIAHVMFREFRGSGAFRVLSPRREKECDNHSRDREEISM
jgi:hypothetical protein